MAPSVGNSTSHVQAVHDTIKGNAGLQQRQQLIRILGQKRPRDRDPARPAYDAAFQQLRDVIAQLDELTAPQIGVLLNVSDSTWRHASAGAAHALGRKPVRNTVKGQGSRVSFVYDRESVLRFWAKYFKTKHAKHQPPPKILPSPIEQPPSFESTQDAVEEPFYAIVDSTGTVVAQIVVNGLGEQELLRVFQAGARIIRYSLTQALLLSWTSEDERGPWLEVWNQAMSRTRSRMDEVALTAALQSREGKVRPRNAPQL